MAYEWKYSPHGDFLEMKLLRDGDEVAEFVALQECDGEGYPYLLESSVILFVRWRKTRLEEVYGLLTAPGLKICDAAVLAATKNKLAYIRILPGDKPANEAVFYAHSATAEEFKGKIREWVKLRKLEFPKEKIN